MNQMKVKRKYSSLLSYEGYFSETIYQFISFERDENFKMKKRRRGEFKVRFW